MLYFLSVLVDRPAETDNLQSLLDSLPEDAIYVYDIADRDVMTDQSLAKKWASSRPYACVAHS